MAVPIVTAFSAQLQPVVLAYNGIWSDLPSFSPSQLMSNNMTGWVVCTTMR